MLYPHHDGSELYLSKTQPALGDKVTFRVRVPETSNVERILIRIYHDGEPRYFDLKRTARRSGEWWWSAKIAVINHRTRYRFLLISSSGQSWLNAGGVSDSDVTSGEDFQIIAGLPIPKWIRSSVFYQIFPDRFARSKRSNSAHHSFVPREWDELPKGKDKTTGVEYFGGDLHGVRDHLDHLEELGVNGIYFTPIFPARSTHRYDASSFDEVDPLLGGNRALSDLSREARSRSMRLVGDLTTNHCGAGHPWLARALKDKRSVERGFFYWDRRIKDGYVGWWGLASLPKLNFASKELRELMFSGKRSILRRWLRPPYSLSGWRIDVGNMTGRYEGVDINQEIIGEIRDVISQEFPDAWLVAENADNHPEDLTGLGWHGTMNYNGFMRPLWSWLHHRPEIKYGFFGVPIEIPTFDGRQFVDSLKKFQAMVPWQSLVASMTLLDSHDTARFRNVVGFDRHRHRAAVGLLMTYPGVPSIFAGDEIGLEGAWGEDARRTMPWEKQSEWDYDLFNDFKDLIAIRRSSHALANGGLRWVTATADYVIFERESKKEKIGIVVSRTENTVTTPHHWPRGKTLFGPIFGRKLVFSQPGVGIYRI